MAATTAVAKPALYTLALLRLVLGLIFLWAFFDKAFGLKFSTPADAGWLGEDGSPTKGYLGSSYGPFEGVFKDMAGNALVDFLFMFGLFAVGLSLTLGFATKLGGWGGVAMVLLMYLSHPTVWVLVDDSLPHGTHPFLDSHIVEATALATLALTNCGDWLGIGPWWRGKTAKMTWLH